MLTVLSVLLFGAVAALADDPIAACYYNSKSIQYSNEAQFGVSDIPFDLCTHVSYRFLTANADGTITLPSEATYTDPDTGKSSDISEFTAYKASYPDVKFFVNIGDKDSPSEFSAIVNSDTVRATFIQNCVDLLKTYSLDGINLAWYYPGVGDNSADTDKAQFVVLLSELKEALEASESGYLLAVVVSADPSVIDTSYDVENMAQVIDHACIASYEYHTASDGRTGASAPAYPQPNDDADTHSNLNNTIGTWISKGMPPNKLVLGVASFAKTFTLADSSAYDTGAESTGVGEKGPYTEDAGYLAYYEVEEYIKSGGYTPVQVDKNYVYAYKDAQWITYDNEETMTEKGLLAYQWGLPGFVLRVIDRDDFISEDNKFPLLKSAIAGYKSGDSIIYSV